MASLTATNISHRFPDGLDVLTDISLTLQSRAFVTLVGQSGVGKSTLLRILAGLVKPTAGAISVQNERAGDDSFGIVFQQDNLMPWRTAYENVRLPLEIRGEQDNGRVQEMIRLVGLEGFERSYPAQLSGGMKQRVALARALVFEPSILLLDEPFGALDALTRERMAQELLRIWQAHPVTVLMVTHSISEAVFLADEVLVMGTAAEGETAATITHHIPVPIARPREFGMQRREDFLGCETAVRQALE